eukprot:6198548-Pleurochrysis_carterae.AAC.2
MLHNLCTIAGESERMPGAWRSLCEPCVQLGEGVRMCMRAESRIRWGCLGADGVCKLHVAAHKQKRAFELASAVAYACRDGASARASAELSPSILTCNIPTRNAIARANA